MKRSLFLSPLLVLAACFPESDLEARVAALEAAQGGADTGADDVVALKADVETLKTEVADDDSAIATLQAQLDSANATIAALQDEVDALTTSTGSAIAALDTAVSELQGSDAAQDVAIASLQSSDAAQDVAIAALDTAVSELQTSEVTQDSAIAGLVSSDTTQDGRLTDFETHDGALDSAVAALQTSDSSQDSEIGSLDERVTAVEGAGYATEGDVAGYLADEGYVRVLSVDAPEANQTVCSAEELEAALETLDQFRIPVGVTATIRLGTTSEGCSYTFDSGLVLGHPDGGRIRLVGDDADPDNVVLDFTALGANSAAFSAYAEGHLYLSGARLVGPGSGSDSYGILVADESSAWVDALHIEGFRVGAEVAQSSELRTTNLYGDLVLGGNGVGVLAEQASYIELVSLQCTSNTSTCAEAVDASTIALYSAVLTENPDGVYADSGSSLVLSSSTITGTGTDAGHGLQLRTGATATTEETTIQNFYYGVYAEGGSTLDVISTTVDGCRSGINLVAAALSARSGATLEVTDSTEDALDASLLSTVELPDLTISGSGRYDINAGLGAYVYATGSWSSDKTYEANGGAIY